MSRECFWGENETGTDLGWGRERVRVLQPRERVIGSLQRDGNFFASIVWRACVQPTVERRNEVERIKEIAMRAASWLVPP
jgi:hypothetical protein